jgi:hypothetical protein
MSTKFTRFALVVAFIMAVSSSFAPPAEAHRRGSGVAAGVALGALLGLGIAGAYSGPSYYGPACYAGPRRCDWVGRRCWHNRFGEHVCGGGEWRCWRPRICD